MQSRVKEILNKAIVSDIAIGFEPEIEVSHKWDLLPRYQQNGFSYLGLAIAGEFTSLETTLHYLARHRARIQAESDKYIIVEKVEDIERAKDENKLALGFWFQGTAPLGNDLHLIQTFYQLGVRYLTLAYNTRNAIGDGVIEPHQVGLSAFGQKFIAEMNRVGMLIDLSHVGHQTTMEVMEATKDPVIFSHSNAYALQPHVRMLKDDQIKALAKTGGVIGINGMAMMLGKEEKSTSKQYVDHIEYVSNLVGHEYVGLGLDLVYFHEVLELFWQKASVTTYPKKGYVGSMDSLQPEKITEVIEEMLKRHFSEQQIMDVLGGNFLRVAKRVWK